MSHRYPFVVQSSGRIAVRLHVQLLGGRTEQLQRCLGTTCRRTARLRREALLRALGLLGSPS